MKKNLEALGGSIGILLILSLLVSRWMPLKQALLATFGTVYTLFIPGYIWSWMIWKNKEIGTLERTTYSTILSIITIPLLLYFLTRIHISLTLYTSLMVATALNCLGLIIIGFTKSKLMKHHH